MVVVWQREDTIHSLKNLGMCYYSCLACLTLYSAILVIYLRTETQHQTEGMVENILQEIRDISDNSIELRVNALHPKH